MGGIVSICRTGVALAAIAACAIPAGADVRAGEARADVLVRTIPFAVAEMDDRQPRQTLHLPVGPANGLHAIELILPWQFDRPASPETVLRMVVAGRIVATIPVAGRTTGVARVSVPVDTVREGVVVAEFALSDPKAAAQCLGTEARNSLHIGPNARAEVALDRSTAGDPASLIAHAPLPLVLTLPDEPSEGTVATALLLAAERPTRFAKSGPVGPDWQETRIQIAAAPKGKVDLTMAVPGSAPLRIEAQSPEEIAQLFTRPSKADNASAVATLPFSAIAADIAPRPISDRGGWMLSLPATGLPHGRTLSRIVADVRLDGGPRGDPAVVTVALNGTLIGSKVARPGKATRLDLEVPDNLATTVNRIDINVLREHTREDCLGGSTIATLLPESHIALGEAKPAADFHDLPSSVADGAKLVFAAAPSAADVASIAGLLRGLLSPHARLAVRFGDLPENGPAIWVSHTPPPGAKPPMRLSGRAERIRDADGEVVLPDAVIDRLTVAQLVETGDRPILWIRPGQDFAGLANLPQGAELAFGNVAMFDGSQRVFAMHSMRERIVKIEREGDFDPARWMEGHRIWLVLLAWAAISTLFGWLLLQTRKARRDDTIRGLNA
ncbi:hypothetical protein [Croceicoccus naphthovorans]|uniref:Uncharacterized protein n=1 Tax=Croceicoccus naphthovorans TaxID=1348774 RepID=A0A0G3XCQ0_9SPHN|nr:hypothetical protein [Croceicoccus naphthovorans]AKM09330.1 hypothetical protein AB433_03990 [Croceicoccus naphthovorans]MBB3990241.1 hypothetical protein [Croceicoccus naphthovorans]